MTREVWRDVAGYEGLYQVSNYGNVRSLDRKVLVKQKHREFWQTRHGQTLKPHVDKYGYLYVSIRGHNRKIHRLVMEAFVGKSNLTVNHKDEDKTNNHLDNLEYMTSRDNLLYGTGMDRRRLSARRRCKPVEQIDPKTNVVIKRYAGLVDTDLDGFCSQTVGKVCMGQRPTHKGFLWRYASA